MKTTDKEPWKEFIDENKVELNQRKPKDLWNSIEEKLDPVEKKSPKLVPLWKVYRLAAILIVALTAGYFLMNRELVDTPVTADTQKQETQEQGYSSEFVEAENYYAAEIDQKMNELVELIDDETLIEEIKELRKEFDHLKLEMGDQVNDQRIIEALIQNYRLRLNLLKEMLDQIKSDGTESKNKKYETNAI
ncbi:MAG: hypothetical protein JKY48_19205 [Flavobacteriales bacterium]|nr:hypothetical protein [Flavobacteriales bacterium]